MRVLLVCLFFIAGCASPAPQYFGAVRHDVTLRGVSFAVFHHPGGAEAEVIRLGYLTRAQREAVTPLIYAAAEHATGCRGVANSLKSRIPGDTAEGRVALRC